VGRRIVLGWLLTRAVVIVALVAFEGSRGVAGDLNYFATELQRSGTTGLGATLTEYPLPAVAAAAVPMLLAQLAGSTGLFWLMFLVLALVLDALFTLFLHRRSGPDDGTAALFWLVAVPLLGSISIARLDLLVGVLVAYGVVVAAQRPRLAAAALSVATGLKLWPVLVLPGLLASSRRRAWTVAVVAALGAALAGGTVIVAGWGRLLSPLTYQSERGLQVESVIATPLMSVWAVARDPWQVEYAASRSFEVCGPGAAALLLMSTVLTVGLAIGFVVLSLRLLRNGRPSVASLIWFAMAVTSGFLVSAKVLSPQYLLWLLPVVAAGLAVAPSRPLLRWGVCLLSVAALTHLVYPVLYGGLVEPEPYTWLSVTLLAARNVGLVVLMVSASVQAWSTTTVRPRAESSHPARTGA